jgi:hypothetical protein
MDLQTKRQRILELLDKNLFLNEKNREKFRAITQGDDEIKLNKVLNFLTQANQQEREAVKKKLADDPSFFSGLKHNAYMTILSDIKSKETAEQSAEESIFDDLEAELEAL